ncbi:MAG: LysR family transcriptional regulator [Xanthobacteraceae bacterium]|nr:LysR family transcriptional regulator [Xanthobacteraceae bacterium]
MLDLDLLRSFVSVVDAGGFTRASQRVHRTQAAVSQQIKRLEQALGCPVFVRDGGGGRSVTPTEAGERLLAYARRILALTEEARQVVGQPGESVIRLGIPEDFAAARLTEVLARSMRARPKLRLDVRCDLSVNLRNELDRGDLDLILFKRDAGERGGLAAWRERLRWVVSGRRSIDVRRDPVPLVAFPQGCLYRNRAIHALEAAGRTWYIAYSSPNFSGVQAAVSAGFGISILPHTAILPQHRVLGARDGFPKVEDTELALLASPSARPTTQHLAEVLAEFCAAERRLVA